MLKHPFLFALAMGAVTGVLSLPHVPRLQALSQAIGMFLGVVIILLTLKALVAIWRAAQGISIKGAARSAGSAVQHLDRIKQAFRGGRNS